MPFFISAYLRTHWAVAFSFAVYCVATVWHVGHAPADEPTPFFGWFWAWQFLFLGSVATGTNYGVVLRKLPPLSTMLLPILAYFFIEYFLAGQKWIQPRLSGKYELGPFRLVDLMIVAYVGAKIVPMEVKPLHWLGRSVRALGSNSLFAFAFTLPLCYLASNILEVLDGSRAIYLSVLLAELVVMLALGIAFATNEKFRRATQAKWVERIVGAFWRPTRLTTS